MQKCNPDVLVQVVATSFPFSYQLWRVNWWFIVNAVIYYVSLSKIVQYCHLQKDVEFILSEDIAQSEATNITQKILQAIIPAFPSKCICKYLNFRPACILIGFLCNIHI